MSVILDFEEYMTHFVEKIRLDLEKRRRQDRALIALNAVPINKASNKDILQVDRIHFYPKNNAAEHKTIRYDLIHRQQPETAILRRGQTFTFIVRFTHNKSFVAAKDILRLNFNYGPAPSVLKHTQGIVTVKGDEDFSLEKDQWDVRVLGQDKDSITLQVQIPADVPVGIWRLQIITAENQAPNKLKIYDCTKDIYILFNPWCKDDSVHMVECSADDECFTDDKRLEEYVLADVGKIWMGSFGSATGRQWVFGQYDDATLPVCVYLLERCGLLHHDRGNPILVSRALSKMVNSLDDDGILQGNWSGKYDDGMAPSAWTGSVKILEEYLLTRKPVKYGQCWVFAGVLTTVCRALGIPARPVSNLVSAHDTNGTLTIDRYYDARNNELDYDPFNPDGGKDSIWNFHCWTEAWMSREDLPKGYGGWQAIDATPQEKSNGLYQLGPASVEAVKKGQIGLLYDVPFVLAEVNADLVRWRADKSSSIGFIRIDTNQYHIGRQILTKKVNVFDGAGESDAEDITKNYKSDEGTQEERINLYNAVRSSRQAQRFFRMPSTASEDVVFDLVELERVPIGESFNVVVTVQNRSSTVRSVNCVLSATTNFYNGVKAHEVRRANGIFVLQPMAREELRLPVSATDYMSKLVEYGLMKLHAAAFVKETNQSWVEEDDFQVIMPTIDITVAGPAKVGQELKVTFKMVNTLQTRLTSCKLHYEGPGLSRSEALDCNDLPPGETLSINIKLTPKFTGEHNLVGILHSKQFAAISGSLKIAVSK